MACSWIGVGSDVAHGGDAGEQLALEPERGERGDLDLGGRPGGLLDVLALGVALVDALAAAALAVSAAAAVTVAVAAALAATVVAPPAVVTAALVTVAAALAALAGALDALGRGGRRRLRRACRVAGGRGVRRGLRAAGLRLRAAALRGAVGAAAAVAAPAAALAAGLLSALGRRGARGRGALGAGGDGRVGGAGGHRCSLPRRLRTRRRLALHGSMRMLAGDQRCAREFVLWGAALGAARLTTDWCSFPFRTLPGGHNVWGSAAGGSPGAWRLGRYRLPSSESNLIRSRFYPQAATPTRRPPSPPEASPPRASWRASPRTSACRRG